MEINKCVFCGSDAIAKEARGAVLVHCTNGMCLCGPDMPSASEAIAAWNRIRLDGAHATFDFEKLKENLGESSPLKCKGCGRETTSLIGNGMCSMCKSAHDYAEYCGELKDGGLIHDANFSANSHDAADDALMLDALAKCCESLCSPRFMPMDSETRINQVMVSMEAFDSYNTVCAAIQRIAMRVK